MFLYEEGQRIQYFLNTVGSVISYTYALNRVSSVTTRDSC